MVRVLWPSSKAAPGTGCRWWMTGFGGGTNRLDLIAATLARHPEPKPPAALIIADFDPALIVAARAAGVPVIAKPLRPSRLRDLLGLPEVVPSHRVGVQIEPDGIVIKSK